jgi:hypothetical protein
MSAKVVANPFHKTRPNMIATENPVFGVPMAPNRTRRASKNNVVTTNNPAKMALFSEAWRLKQNKPLRGTYVTNPLNVLPKARRNRSRRNRRNNRKTRRSRR